MEKKLGGANELLLYIYEYLCSEENDVHVADLQHGYIHDYSTGEDVQAVANGGIGPSTTTHQKRKKSA